MICVDFSTISFRNSHCSWSIESSRLGWLKNTNHDKNMTCADGLVVRVVLAVAPTASWFEYLDIAGAVLTERLLPVDGMVTGRGLGLGLDWDEHAVARYAFS
jgi:hypothetical protein